ncbi:TonB-dependent receptor [uncultured Polaribacter sp.]|uniref:SusC/RagA family TonB-linked outer membrane protein n=1 Tax=uncultured Polaribacter sp. TaxID=174711 RepID=UPI002631F969|nr:TonB-dependent receptor [uncultured Polaribacter sp.]
MKKQKLLFWLQANKQGSIKMMTKNILFFALLLSTLGILSQTRTITGKVVDTDNFPLPSASVSLQNTTNGVNTNFDGMYTITIPTKGNFNLVFRYIGYETKVVAVTNQSTINVTLTEDVTALEEIIVVGYGTQKKESLSAAVAVISGAEIETTTNVSLAQKLTGKIAGVQIRQQSGQPGSFDNDINIRGFGNPIYVIDGIRRGGSSDFQQLNSDDIETISILKDASAAIYGLGAANGVILVTTKKGKNSKPSFNYSTVTSSARPTDVPLMANAAQYTQMWNDTQLFIPGGAGVPFYSPEEIEKWKNGGPGYESTDWGALTLKEQALTQQHNFSASGGNEKTNYFMSFGYVQEDGLLISNDVGYERYTFRTNLTTELSTNLTASLLINGRWDENTQPGANFFNIFKGTRLALPTESAYANNNPNFLAPIASGLNPVAFMERDLTGYTDNNTRAFTSTFSVEYKVPFVEGLRLKGVVAYDANNFQSKSLAPTYNLFNYDEVNDVYNPVKQNDGVANIANENRNGDGMTYQGYINYDKVFADDHDFKALLLVESNSYSDRFSRIRRFYPEFYTKDQLRFASPIGQESDGIESESADFSYAARLNYGYKGKYFLEVSARYMGSYRYAPENRYGLYPTATAAWRISEERFIKDNLDWISNIKLRGSYGIAGQPEGGPFQYVPGYSIGSGGSYEFDEGFLTDGIRTPPIPNPNLTWMEATTSNIGLELGFLNNRLNITIDAYQRELDGIPARRSIALPNTYGGVLPQENLNSEITQGIEFTAGYRQRVTQDFKFDISGNFSYSRTKRNFVEGEAFNNSYSEWRNRQSGRWNDIAWGYNYIGQFQSEEALRSAALQNGDRSNVLRELPGDFQYEDWNNDGIVDGQDEQPLFFSGRPKMFFGLTLNLEYKGFYLNSLFQGAANYTVRFRETYAEMFAFRGNTPAYFYDRWRKEDPYDVTSEWIPGTWPASRTIADVGSLYKESSVWRRDASYLRLKSVEFGYNFKNEGMKETLGITNLRLYVSGFNLYTWADDFVKPFDPEKIEGAFSAGFTYPVTKTYNFGVNINF